MNETEKYFRSLEKRINEINYYTEGERSVDMKFRIRPHFFELSLDKETWFTIQIPMNSEYDYEDFEFLVALSPTIIATNLLGWEYITDEKTENSKDYRELGNILVRDVELALNFLSHTEGF